MGRIKKLRLILKRSFYANYSMNLRHGNFMCRNLAVCGGYFYNKCLTCSLFQTELCLRCAFNRAALHIYNPYILHILTTDTNAVPLNVNISVLLGSDGLNTCGLVRTVKIKHIDSSRFTRKNRYALFIDSDRFLNVSNDIDVCILEIFVENRNRLTLIVGNGNAGRTSILPCNINRKVFNSLQASHVSTIPCRR